MARVYTCGFESQTTANGVEFTSQTGGVFTIDTTYTKNSAASASVANVGSLAYFLASFRDSVSTLNHYYSVDVWCSLVGSADNPFFGGVYSTSYTQRLWTLSLDSSGVLTLKNRAGTTVGTGSNLLSPTELWHRVEVFEEYRAAGSGYTRVTVRVNGVQDIAATVVGDATGNASRQLFFGCIGPVLSGTHAARFDNIRINDSNGTNDNSWCGEGYVLHAYPDADGGEQDWAIGGGAGAHYTLVNEVGAFDETNYVVRNTVGTALTVTELFKISAPARLGPNDTVRFVAVGVRNGSNSNTTGNRTARLVMTSQAGGTQANNGSDMDWSINGWGTNYDENDVAIIGSAPGHYQFIRYTEPQASAAWTKATVDTAEIGGTNATSSTQELRIATIWAMIEYVPAASTGARLLSLLGVGT